MAKMEDESEDVIYGHVTSLSVLRTHRKLGIATLLMNATHRVMSEVKDCVYVTLHVRESNVAALHLYKNTLGYETANVDEKYYADSENAFEMRKTFKKNEKKS